MADHGELTADELNGILTWSIVRVARFAGQRLSDRLAEHGLNPIQFGVLAHLAIASEMTQSDLARAVLVRPQSIAPLLDGLESRGLILRSGARSRGRRNPVRITAEGRGALEAVWGVVVSTNDLGDAGLTLAESTELNRLLLKVIRATDGARPSGTDELWRMADPGSP